jgi:exodeoxyribonuclease VII large subunit
MEKLRNLRLFVSENGKQMTRSLKHAIEIHRQRVGGILGKLDSLSPLSILRRGYSITRQLPSMQILREAARVKAGDKVEVKLFRGTLLCGVEKTEKP